MLCYLGGMDYKCIIAHEKHNISSMMNKNFDLKSVFGDEIVDDFGELEEEMPDRNNGRKGAVQPIHADWTIVDAFNVINEHAPKSCLRNELFVKCAEAFSFLTEKTGLNPMQSIIVAMLLEEGTPMSTRQMGKVLGLSNLSMMTHHNDLEELFRMRWLQHRRRFDHGQSFEAYALAEGVTKATRENRPFEPEVLECENQQAFVNKLAFHFNEGFDTNDDDFEDEIYWMQQLVEANKELPLCKVALEKVRKDTNLLLMMVADYYKYNGAPNEGLTPDEVKLAYPITGDYEACRMQSGIHPLFENNLVQHRCEGGMANTNAFVLTDYVKDELLKDVNVNSYADKRMPVLRGLKSHTDITPKKLFYNEEERSQVERLRSILSAEQLPIIQQRLEKKGMRTGVCVLMHGGPGTGKTATAYELARQTGRDIIQVQVTDFKDKYVGESEAKLKRIFTNYRKYCEKCETMPILLLNEGDAILSKRLENVEHGAEQMMNALQNILLEEMENLKGIMIVTTNLTVNLDKAFERRFIFKIKFEKPSTEVKAHIWQSMIDGLNDTDARELARMYDVSGGEIENIARKSTMEYILTGQEPDIEMLKSFTQQEKLEQQGHKVIGF